MKIIFDLDYTLLDTGRFKNDLAGVFSKENFYTDYKKYFKNQGINFDTKKYLAILRAEGRLDGRREKELKLSLRESMGRLDNYLIKDAIKILKNLRDSGAELILITFGDKSWQKKKIENLSIRRYFKQIIFAERNKSTSKYLKNIQEEILIVNDNAKEAKEMIKIIGKKAKLFLIDGPYIKNIKHNWPSHKLNELSYDHK